MNACQFV